MAKFWAEFLANPRAVGAPTRCSKEVGALMAEAARVQEAETVVEFGPGTGVITGEILPRLKEEAVFFAIEINQALAEATQKKYPGTQVYVDSCERVLHYLHENGREKADAIVCTIPWAMMKEEDTARILDEVQKALHPGGRFVTVGLSAGKKFPGGRRLKKHLKKRFKKVETSKTIWSNIPPAFYYTCHTD